MSPIELLGILCLLAFSLTLQAQLPDLPEPVANNAVAQVNIDGQAYLLSFNGLASGKTYRDVHNRVWSLALPPQLTTDDHSQVDNSQTETGWKPMAPVPSALAIKGRLASVAVGVGAHAYVFGGYTVDKDHNEISSPDVHRYDLKQDRFVALPPMPVPVDDSVAVVYQNRFIYLISGWHNDGNVNLVQMYDLETKTWTQASPFPGQAVFGHAGGIVGNSMVICDGVGVQVKVDTRRQFGMVSQCFLGEIDQENPSKIRWYTLPHHSGAGRYRMAATGLETLGKIVFAGGTRTAYNYNGTGYNGQPASPVAQAEVFDIASRTWERMALKHATMDHRGLLWHDANLIIIGGMGANQKVLKTVYTHSFPPK